MSVHDELERELRVAKPGGDAAGQRDQAPALPVTVTHDRSRRSPMSPQSFMALQRHVGNHAVVSVMRDEDEESASSQESSVDEAGPISSEVEADSSDSGSADTGTGGSGTGGSGESGSGGDQDGGVSGGVEEQSTSSGTGSATPADGSGETFVLTEEFVPSPAVGAPDTAAREPNAGPAASGFSDAGMVGVTPFRPATDHEDMGIPHVFTNGGQTGTIAWAGGGGAGAHGNQGVGSIQTQVVPTFAGAPGPTPGKFSSRITPGTGLLAVTRSYVGAFAGDQGNGQWVSASAVARINQHEQNHVASTQGIYATNLTPVETRVANAALGVDAGATAPEAVAAHKAAINWVPSVNAFITADTAANKPPNGTIDTADVAAGWIQNLGPGNVLGVAFAQRVVRAGEAAPPAAAPGPPAGP